MGLFKLKRKSHHEPTGSEPHYVVTEENPLYRGDNHDESNWLVSYADMMTLLCGFFIMLFSIATIDQTKYEAMQKSVSQQFGGKFVDPHTELKKSIRDVIEANAWESSIHVTDSEKGVAVVFQTTTFFETASAELTSDSYKMLAPFAREVLRLQKEKNKRYTIRVEGHSDSRKMSGGLYPSNWELSSARAARVVRFLIENGFEAGYMTALGYADTRPAVATRSPASYDDPAHDKNRRVVIAIEEP